MADSTNSIDIVVADKVDASIAPKLIAIADGADKAGSSVGSLKAQLAGIQSSGLGGLSQMLQETQGSTSALAGASDTLASALDTSVSATVRSTVATQAKVVVERESVVATGGLVSANVAAAAAIGVLEGRTLGTTRAAANFITKILGMGGALQTAFTYIIGPAALLFVLYQIGDAVYKIDKEATNAGHNIAIAFDSIIDPLRKTNDSLAVTNDKLDETIAKLEHKPTSNGAQLAIDQARQAADRLDDSLERVDKDLDSILTKNRISLLGSIFTGNAPTKDTETAIRTAFDSLDKVRQTAKTALDSAEANKDPKAAASATVAAYTNERSAIQGVIDTLNAQYNAKKKLQDIYENQEKINAKSLFTNPATGNMYENQTANLTSLGKSVQLAQQDLRGLDETMDNIGKNATVDKLRDQVSEQRNEVKQAAIEWKALEAAYVAFQDKITSTGQKPTPQQDLGFLQGQEAGINPLNREKLAAREQPIKNTIAGQDFGQDQITKLADVATNMNLYGTALKQTTEYDRILQEAEKKHITLDQDTLDLIQLYITYNASGIELQKEKTSIQLAAIKVETDYNLALQAGAIVMKEHPELADAISRDLNKMTIAHNDLKDPMLEFNRNIDQQRALLGQYGDQLQVSQQVQARANQLRSEGVTNFQQEAEAQRANLTLLQQQEQLQAANKAVYEETTGALQKLTIQKEALNAASATELSNEAKRSALTRNAGATNDLQLQNGQATSQKAPFVGALQDFVKNFTTVAAGLKKVYSETFSTIADGVADSLGRAVAYGENFGKALKDVARSAIGELISGLVKLGIQMLVVYALQKLLGQSSQNDDVKKQIASQVLLTSSSIAAMAAITIAGETAAAALALAWWPVAEAVSLASFGSNAAGAAAGMGTIIALGAAASLPKLATGTNYVPHDMFARIHEGEAVVPKQYNPAAGGQSVGSSSKPVSIELHQYPGVALSTETMSEGRVKIIAKQAVHEHADAAAANAVANPNSATSKVLRQQTTLTRRRAN